MMRFFRMTTVFGLLFFLATVGLVSGEEESFSQPEGGVSVSLIPGKHYTHWKWFGILPLRLTPTLAVWAEDSEGNFAGTLFITRKAGEGRWTGGKNISRPEALPVYTERLRSASRKADSVSGATPKFAERVDIESSSILNPGEYRFFAEVNASYDFNDTYPMAESDVNGQPSLIFMGSGVCGSGPVSVELHPVGKSDPSGSSGEMTGNTDGLTTALHIVESIRVEILR